MSQPRALRPVLAVLGLAFAVSACASEEPVASDRGSETPDEVADVDDRGSGAPDEAVDVDETDQTDDEPEAGSSSSERLTLRTAGSIEGAPMGFAEYLPPGYGSGEPSPLLVSLHGSDEAGIGDESALGGLFVHGVAGLIDGNRWPDERPFVVLMPQYGVELARSCDLAADLEAFLAFATSYYDVDPDRVYVTGVSCGASGTWGYLAEDREVPVAAAVLIAGRAVTAFNEAGCDLGRTPLWVIHGELDDLVHPRSVVPAVEQLQACTDPPPGDVRLTVYPDGGHEVWDRTYDLSAGHDVFAWLLEHASE